MARTILVGRAGSPGVGVGRLLLLAPPMTTPVSDPTAGRPQDPEAEHDRLSDALERFAAELEMLAVQTTARAGEAVGAIFEAQALFARDHGIIDPAFALIEAGVCADEAILRATADQADRLAAAVDEYFGERAADVRDVGRPRGIARRRHAATGLVAPIAPTRSSRTWRAHSSRPSCA